MDLKLLKEKYFKAKLSYDRQLSLSGNPRYDPKLTFDLKRDIEWLEKQIKLLGKTNISTSNEDEKDNK